MSLSNNHAAKLMVILAGIAVFPVHAAIFKCKQGAQVIYSDKPCTDAKPVDTTNGRAPTATDVIRAQTRSKIDRLTVLEAEARAQLEKERQARCNQMARDHNWVQSRAVKYSNDPWWINKAIDSAETLNKECSGYLIPQGAR